MTKHLSITGQECSACGSDLNDKSLLLHKTRRQRHALCQTCATEWHRTVWLPRTQQRQPSLLLSCTGNYDNQIRNTCRKEMDIRSLDLTHHPQLDMTRAKLATLQDPQALNCRGCDAIYLAEHGQARAECPHPECGQSICSRCFISPYHEGRECQEVDLWQLLKRQSPELVQHLSETGGKFCPTCHQGVQKAGGCNKMTCLHCRQTFCWLCLMANIGYQHFYLDSPALECRGRLFPLGTRE